MVKELRNANLITFEKILDVSPGYFYWKNKQGVYLGCNQRVAQLANLPSKADVIGKTDEELWPHYAKNLRLNDQYVMNVGHVMTFEEKIHNSTNISVKTPLENEAGEVIGIIGNSFDITHLKKMENSLKEAQEIAEAAKLLSKNKFSFFKPWKKTQASQFLKDNVDF